tara:strand:- start:6327 stop:6614 length:288 start_codon:yes stop_codon:yes gene_type:complete
MEPENKSTDKDSVIRKLSSKVKALENKLELLEKKKWSEYIDEYIDIWFEENKEEVDIGRVKIGGMFEVDLLPDKLEKQIYKKVFKILYSLLKQKL